MEKKFDLVKRDGRKALYLTIDVETASGIRTPLIYDIALVVHDKTGIIFYKRNFLVNEVWNNQELMKTAYYYDKVPLYVEKLRKNEIEIRPFNQILSFIDNLIKEYNVKYISAYNLNFDIRAIAYTYSRLNMVKLNKNYYEFFTRVIAKRAVKYRCIWSIAVQTIGTQVNYIRFCMKYDLYTESKKYISTSAETMFRYLKNQPDYIEQHTALDDALIEIEILALALRQKKSFESIIHDAWQFPQSKYFEIRDSL